MAVDRGYGSGKPLSAAQSASRRAAAGKAASRKKTVAAAGKKYGQKKGMSYTNPGMLASQKKRMTLDNRRTSDSLLEAFTGFNKKDGVDAGDFAGLAISIPTGGVGGALLRAGARAVIPKAARIASAAKRVTARNKSAAEAMSSRYREKSTEALEKRYAAKEMVQPKYVGSETYEDRAFTDWSGGVDRAGNERTYFSRIAENLRNRGDVVRTNVQRDAFGVTEQYSQMPSFKQKVDAYSMDVDSVFADRAANRAASEARRISSLGRDTTAASAAEIKRRLAALKRANRNR